MRCTVRSWGIRGVLLEKKGSRGGPQGRNGQAQVGGEGLRGQRVQGEGKRVFTATAKAPRCEREE